MINFSCMKDLVDLVKTEQKSIAEIIVEYEAQHSQKSIEEVNKNMSEIWQVMKESAFNGVNNTKKSVSGMVGGDAKNYLCMNMDIVVIL